MVYGFFYSRKISNGTYFQASSGNDFQASITDDLQASIGKIHTTANSNYVTYKLCR